VARRRVEAEGTWIPEVLQTGVLVLLSTHTMQQANGHRRGTSPGAAEGPCTTDPRLEGLRCGLLRGSLHTASREQAPARHKDR